MDHENKIAIAVENELLDWQKLNVVAFLASSVAIGIPETHGRAFVTASKSEYLPFIRQPFIIYGANSSEELKRAFKRAQDRELQIGIYTRPLFATKTENDNLSEIAKVFDEEQDLVGLVVYGPFRKVNKAFDGLKFHP